MGKREKKQRHQRAHRGAFNYHQEEDDDSAYQLSQPYSSSSAPPRHADEDKELEEEEEEEENDDSQNNEEETGNYENLLNDLPSKFLLYQQSVQVCQSYHCLSYCAVWLLGKCMKRLNF